MLVLLGAVCLVSAAWPDDGQRRRIVAALALTGVLAAIVVGLGLLDDLEVAGGDLLAEPGLLDEPAKRCRKANPASSENTTVTTITIKPSSRVSGNRKTAENPSRLARKKNRSVILIRES